MTKLNFGFCSHEEYPPSSQYPINKNL